MHILKNLIFALFIIIFLNFGNIEKIIATTHFLPLKQANIAFVGFGASGKTALRGILADESFDYFTNCHTLRNNVIRRNLNVDDGHDQIYAVDCKLWDTPGHPKDKDNIINYLCKYMDIIVITISLYDPYNEGIWREMMHRSILEWQSQILKINPNAKIILACTKSDLANPNELKDIETAINNFTDAEQALGGSVRSLVLSARTGHNLNALMQIIEDDLREIGLDNLRDVGEKLPCEPTEKICLLL